eukprot:TRINITY_DN67711_c0_g1_i1.p1 TRINITY_DN67711_c0_g1~~TRINITY_DN67711_c0_g1_i1.p1  ORF type:complete len:481 (+),score=115.42 TRINITY_DN67711_c0_g1_i1:62-1504(+)
MRPVLSAHAQLRKAVGGLVRRAADGRLVQKVWQPSSAAPARRRLCATSAQAVGSSTPRRSAKGGRKEEEEIVTVSADRLEQLLEAEITDISLREPKSMTLHNLLDLTSGADSTELAKLLHEELPVRFAQRIKMLEALPDWESKVSIAIVRQMYVTSFKELRMADPNHPEQFHNQIKNVKQRHRKSNLLVGGFKQYAEIEMLDEGTINEWLNRFFVLRISTNMLMSHYLQLSRLPSEPCTRQLDYDPDCNPYRSSIDPQCNAPRIANHAANLVQKMCRMRYGVSPRIDVVNRGAATFAFVPRYLLYILSELLKNSVRAVVETHCPEALSFEAGVTISPHKQQELEAKMPPVVLLVTGDEHICTVRLSDEGGGIPIAHLSHVWSYLYSTAEQVHAPVSRVAIDEPADLQFLQRSSPGDTNQDILMGSPLAGLGCGLPLSRLYAEYLGGSIELQTLPQFGTDVFVYLNKLEKVSETLQTLPQL